MLLHLLFAHVVIQYSPVAKFKFVGSDAKDVRRENERRLTLVTMKLLDRLAPILAAVYVTFVFGNNEWDAVNQKNRILATLFDALDTILVGGSKIVEMLAGGVERHEFHRGPVLGRIERDPRTVSGQIKRLAIGYKLIGVRHGVAERGDGESCLRIRLYRRVDPLDAFNENFLDQRVFQWSVKGGHRCLVAISPAEAGGTGGRCTVAGKPPNDRKFDEAFLTHDWRMALGFFTRTRPVSRSCIRDFLSNCCAGAIASSPSICAVEAEEMRTISLCSSISGIGN